jgi:TP901 family phage tail tape measure protein
MAQAKLELLLELKNRLKAGLGAAKNTVLNELKGLKDKLSDFGSANMKAFSAITSEIPGVSRALGLLANPYALAATAALAFVTAGAAATKMSLEWEKSMAKVNVTAQLNRDQLSDLSSQLRYIGAQGTADLMEVPEAFNRIISAGLSVEQSLAALGPTLKAAKAGFTDIETVAKAGIGVMKSSGEDINVVYDTLFATLNKGNAEFRDIAQYLPKVIPGARLAGAELYETAGAFAFLTAQGQTAEQSTTGLMNAFKALSDPKFIDGFKKIGIDVFDANGKFRGIVPIVEDLNESMKGLNNEQAAYKFDLIGLDQEARMAFGSMIQNVDELKTTIDFTKNSTGQLDEAIKNSATSTEGWAKGWNKIKFLAMEFGDLFVPIVKAIGTGFDTAMTSLMNFFIGAKALFLGVAEMGKELLKVLQPIGEAFLYLNNPAMMMQALSKLPAAFESMDLAGAFGRGAGEVLNSYRAPAAGLTPGVADPTAEGGSGIVPGGGKGTSAGSPTGHQSKSIVINIDALHKGDNKISMNGEGMTITELERKMNEVFLRMVRNVEASY